MSVPDILTALRSGNPVLAAERASRIVPSRGRPLTSQDGTDAGGHRIYLDPWAGEEEDAAAASRRCPAGSRPPS